MSFLRLASAEDLEHAGEYAELHQWKCVIQFVKRDQHPTFLYGVKKPKDPHHHSSVEE